VARPPESKERTLSEKILVAPAWPYASGPRHIGHVAGFGVPSDIFARYHRLNGDDVLMVSGTDEHGTPVMVAADAEGRSPRETADHYNELIRTDLRNLGLSYDLFTRTTTRNHERVTRDVFRALYDHGYIIERTTLGAFSPSTGHTLPDRYIEGTCPICGFPDARGDQCDNCGNLLDPIDLIDPRSKIDGATPEFRETSHLFLDLPAFADRLREWIGRQRHWRPNVRNFSLRYVDDLKPRAVTRDLDWGIRVPVPGYEENPNKRIYVWIDAVVGYLSAAVEWARLRGTPDAWREWWQNPHYYFMGKDNIVFHTVIWPAELLGYETGGELGAGKPLDLPYNVVASEFLTTEGKQFSTSRNVAIWVGDFLSRYDPDPLRFYLTAAGPEQQDTDFTWSDWGNLVNRTLTIAYRNFGAVPEPGPRTAEDEALLASIAAGFGSVGDLIEGARFKAAVGEAMRLSSEVNQYLNDQAPWALLENDRERAATVLYVCLRCVDGLKTIFAPFLPFTSQTVHELLGHEGFLAGPLEFRDVDEDGDAHTVLTGDYASWVGRWEPSELRAGQELREPRPLFRKLDPEQVVAEELERMERAAASA
jgi:methionyl-tRNA synthetase